MRRFLLGLTCGTLACATNPATGERQFALIGEGQEIRLGRDYDQEVVATLGLYPDSGLQRYVHELGLRLARTSERPSLPWTFRVVDDPVVNAFALPGGYIYVTRGILAHFNSEAELAAVLGHEIGHVTARHSVSQISRQQLAQLGLAVGTIVSPELERYAGLASAALGVLFLKYSRDDERQADELGLRYLRRGNYDAREMADVFTMLERVSAAAGGGRVPEWLSTHPDPGNRRARIQQLVAALPPESIGTIVNRDPYLRRLQGLVFGENPRQGFFRGSEFLHPDLRFRLRFPEGWLTQNQRQAVLAASRQQDALIQLTIAPEPTADAAARAFFSRQGVSSGLPSRASINGLPAASGAFTAQTEDGRLAGYAAFVEYGGAVYRLLAYAPETRWPAYEAIALRAIRSFDRLTDRAVLEAEPWRLELVTVERAATLPDLVRRRPSPAPVATLALINQMDTAATLPAGTRLKWIVG
ncbi:MAG TPA: M48 family metalloprotease, partial [Gemmatimonadales bacterium]|nr:M48 family metalloprotease [Gemmatimonadales bacterium]